MSRVYLEKITKSAAFELKDWGRFEDPRLSGYNYGSLSDMETNFWYRSVTTPRKRYFAVRLVEDDRFIGFLGLKNYNPITRRAKLGIVFDPNYVSEGYGYEAMEQFLDYYFNELKFMEMILEVNLFNDRALALYQKLGFHEVGSDEEIFENQDVEYDDRFFDKKHGVIYSKILKMLLTKDEYDEL